MRARLIIWLSAGGLLFCPLSPASISLPSELTVDGVTYHGVQYQKHDAIRVRFSHEDGMAAVEITRLPSGVAQQFHYDAAAAERQRKEEAEAQEHRAEAQLKQKVLAQMDQVYQQALQDVRRRAYEPPADVGIELSNVAFGRKKDVLYRDGKGGAIVEISRSRGVEARVTNKGKSDFRGALRVYFFGRSEGKLYCFDGAQVWIDLAVLETKRFRFDTALTENKGSLPSEGAGWKNGGSYAGQAAEVVDRAGRRVAFFASIPAITPELVDSQVKLSE